MLKGRFYLLLCGLILIHSLASANVESAGVETDDKITIPLAERSTQNNSDGKVTLADTISIALRQSPRLQSHQNAIAAAKGEQQQSSAWINPEINVGAENIAGSGPYKNFSSAEVNYGVAQELEIGGQVAARERIAENSVAIASFESQSARLDLIRDVTIAYFQRVAAEESVNLAQEQKRLAEDVLRSVNVRVGTAAAPLLQRSRAEVERSAASITLEKAIQEKNSAQAAFDALLGEPKIAAKLDSGTFFVVDKPLPVTEAMLEESPIKKRLDATLQQARARTDLEKANAIPNPKLNAGVRDFHSSNDQAFVVGLSMPIPVLNGNNGNIEKASQDALRIEMEGRQAMLDLRSQLQQVQARLDNAYRQAQLLKTEILPSANRGFQLAREGYSLGRFAYLEVLDAQRSLSSAKQQHIDALRDFHIAKAQLERLGAVHAVTPSATQQNQE